MARMHSRRKGKAGSKRPLNPNFAWVKYTGKEIEQLVVKLAKSEKSIAEIGLILRDSYGIPDVKRLTGKKISKIIEENDLKPKIPNDLNNLIKKEITLIKHLEKNKHDQSAKRGLILTDSKIKRLTKFYKNTRVLPKDWVYSKEQAKLIVG